MTKDKDMNNNNNYLFLSNFDIDLLTKDLSKEQLIDLIKLYNEQITSLHEDVEYWKYMACCDAMTTGSMNESEEFDSCGKKVYSRTFWEEIFRPENEDLEGDCYLIDLNDLKKTNDTSGHEEGDKLICDCARLLCQFGMVVRLGGDEFFLIVDKDKEIQFKKYLFEYDNYLPFAYGFYHKKPTDDFSFVMKRTDNSMYEKKKKMKNKKPQESFFDEKNIG